MEVAELIYLLRIWYEYLWKQTIYWTITVIEGRMKLEKRDIAEALGLVYHGTIWNEEDNHVHYFQFHNKDIYVNTWLDIDEAWEEASERVVKSLVLLIEGSL